MVYLQHCHKDHETMTWLYILDLDAGEYLGPTWIKNFPSFPYKFGDMKLWGLKWSSMVQITAMFQTE